MTPTRGWMSPAPPDLIAGKAGRDSSLARVGPMRRVEQIRMPQLDTGTGIGVEGVHTVVLCGHNHNVMRDGLMDTLGNQRG